MSEKTSKKARFSGMKEGIAFERQRILAICDDLKKTILDDAKDKVLKTPAEAHVLDLKVQISGAIVAALQRAIASESIPEAMKVHIQENGERSCD